MRVYKDLKVEDLGSSKYKIEMKLIAQEIENTKTKTLEDKAKNMVIPGFRKGEAPKELVMKQLGEQNILEDAAKDLASMALAQVIVEKQLKVVGRPDIILGEVKSGEDVSFEGYVTVLPEIKINDDYKKSLAKINSETPKEEPVVTDEDVEKVIEHLRREKARILTLQAMQEKKNTNIQMPDINAIPKDKLPELDEKDFKDLAGASSMEEFKEKVKENIKTEKAFAQSEEQRAKLAEELLKHVEVDLPDELVDMEYTRAQAQMEQDLQMMGLTLDAYLAQINKSKEDFEKEMREASKKRAILQLALDKIAEMENIKVSSDEIEKELQHILSHSPQADPNELRAYIDAQKSNEKVFEFLLNLN